MNKLFDNCGLRSDQAIAILFSLADQALTSHESASHRSKLLFALADQAVWGDARLSLPAGVRELLLQEQAARGKSLPLSAGESLHTPSWQAFFDWCESSPPAPEVVSYRDLLEEAYDR